MYHKSYTPVSLHPSNIVLYPSARISTFFLNKPRFFVCTGDITFAFTLLSAVSKTFQTTSRGKCILRQANTVHKVKLHTARLTRAFIKTCNLMPDEIENACKLVDYYKLEEIT